MSAVTVNLFFVHSLNSLTLFTESPHRSHFLSGCFTSSPNFSPNVLLISESCLNGCYMTTLFLNEFFRHSTSKKKCHDAEGQGLFTASPLHPHYLRLHCSFTVCTVTAAFATKQLARPTENLPISQPELESVEKSENSTP